MGSKRIIITFSYIFLSVCALSMLMPFIWMTLTSFMYQRDIFSYPPVLIPKQITFSNYQNVIKTIPVSQYFFNSFFISIAVTIGQIIISSMAAYAFARMNFRFREPLFLILLATMMIPPQVNIIPLFFLMRELNWIDTYYALIVPGLFGGFGIFLLRQWFKSLPKSLEEAAKIDGCNPFQIYRKIIMPLSLPAIATLGIFTFILNWNSFMWPLIVANSDSMRTLTVGITVFKGSFRETTDWGQLMACAVISTLPTVGVFLLGQKYFIQGLVAGSIKE